MGSAVGSVRSIVRPEGLPLVGSVAAGSPVLAEENIEDYVDVPSFAGGESGQFLLRIRGESMKDAGIIEGDLVVVREQNTAENGDIVVALLGEERDRKALLPRTGPHTAPARKRGDGADPQQRGEGARARRRAAQERDVSTAVLDPCARPAAARERGWAPDADAGAGGAVVAAMLDRSSLDAWFTALWSELERGETAECPACGGALGACAPVGHVAREARCEDCGSTLC